MFQRGHPFSQPSGLNPNRITEILSLSFGEEVRQALSYADVTLRAWNKNGWVTKKKKKRERKKKKHSHTTTTNKKRCISKRVGAKLPNGHPPTSPPKNKKIWQLTFYTNRAQLLILSRVLLHPRRTARCDPHSAAPRWRRGKKEMYGYNVQIRWGVSFHSSALELQCTRREGSLRGPSAPRVGSCWL